jgi:hypothetical protein
VSQARTLPGEVIESAARTARIQRRNSAFLPSRSNPTPGTQTSFGVATKRKAGVCKKRTLKAPSAQRSFWTMRSSPLHAAEMARQCSDRNQGLSLCALCSRRGSDHALSVPLVCNRTENTSESHCILNRLAVRGLHGMVEVIGSIPISQEPGEIRLHYHTRPRMSLPAPGSSKTYPESFRNSSRCLFERNSPSTLRKSR